MLTGFLTPAYAAVVGAGELATRSGAGVAQDVYAACVVHGVDDVARDPVRGGGGASEGEEVAFAFDIALLADVEEVGAVLVVADRQEAAVVPRRMNLEPVRRAAEAVYRGSAVGVGAVLDPVGIYELELAGLLACVAS